MTPRATWSLRAAWAAVRPAAIVAVVFYISGQLGYLLHVPGTDVGPFWPASGLALGLLLVLGTGAWPGILVGSAALVLPDLQSGVPLADALVLALGEIAADVVPPLAGAWAVRRAVRGRDPLASAMDLLRLVFWAALAAQGLAASMGVAAIWAGGMVRGPALWGVWASWYASGAASVMLLSPLCLAWRRPWPVGRQRRRFLLAAALAFACGAAVLVVGPDPRMRLAIRSLGLLTVIWSAFSLGPRGATLTALVFSSVAVWTSVTGHGSFGADPVVAQVVLLNVFMGALGFIGLLFAALLAERDAGSARLAENEARLRTILDLAPMPLAMSDAAGRIELMNRRFAEVFGWTPADLPDVASWFLRAYPDPGYREWAAAAWARAEAEARRTGGDATVPDLDVVCKDGSLRRVDLVGTISGERMVVLFVDLTERRRAEAKHEELRSQLAQAQRIESLGRLAGGVAHELNNLLTPVITYAGVLLEGVEPGSETAADLGEIRRAAERARDLTRQLLALARKQVLDVRAVDLRQEVARFERLIRLTVREDVRLELRIPSVLGLVRADSGQLEQVLMNLAMNAQQAMPGGGALTLELADVDAPEARPRPEVPAGSWVRLSVTDTGAGMTPEVLQRIFEPFFTTRKGEGTGLGLPIVHGIVSQHGGHIAVDSSPGRGTAFHVYLPRADGEATVAPAPQATSAPAPQGHGTILLAEDEEIVRRAAVRVLERLGYRVLASQDATSCLAAAVSEPGPIDLLLTDVVMPDLDGRQLHRRLDVLRPGLKVLYMSGYPGSVVMHRGVFEDGAGFLQKPFTAEGLAAAVQRALGG